MSDVMLIGVLRMPYDMATGSELSLRQFHDRARQAAERIESDADLIESLQSQLAAANERAEMYHKELCRIAEKKADVFVAHKPGTGYQTVLRSKTSADLYAKDGFDVTPLYAAPVPAQPAVCHECGEQVEMINGEQKHIPYRKQPAVVPSALTVVGWFTPPCGVEWAPGALANRPAYKQVIYVEADAILSTTDTEVKK